MAVYQRTYTPYTGPLTPRRTRFLVLPRYALREVFASRVFLAFFVLCFIWPAMLLIATYLSYNLKLLELIAATGGGMVTPGSLFNLKFDGAFFMSWYLGPQFWMALLVTFFVAPDLVAPDLSNNGLPLYLCRPFTRTDYVLGKASVLVLLLSAVTWVPGLLLFLLNGYLAGGGWIVANLRIAFALVAASAVAIAVLTLIGLALSAYVRWKPLARLALFGVFLLGAGLGNVINVAVQTTWGSVVDLFQVITVVWGGLFGVRADFELPLAGAWLALIAVSSLFAWVLYRKIEAYEVVR